MTEELGLAQPSGYAERERRPIATHESGHATVAWLVAPERNTGGALDRQAPFERWGCWPIRNRRNVGPAPRREIEALIRIAMGGMVAEELFFGETSSGVAGDLQAATEAAAQMVGSFGMAGSLISLECGPVSGRAQYGRPRTVRCTCRAEVDAILDTARDEVRGPPGGPVVSGGGLAGCSARTRQLIGDEICRYSTTARAATPDVVDLTDGSAGHETPNSVGESPDGLNGPGRRRRQTTQVGTIVSCSQDRLVPLGEDERLDPRFVPPGVVAAGRTPMAGPELGPQQHRRAAGPPAPTERSLATHLAGSQ